MLYLLISQIINLPWLILYIFGLLLSFLFSLESYDFFQFLRSKTGRPEQGVEMGVGEGNTEKREGEPNFLREIAVISPPPTLVAPMRRALH